MRRNPPKDLVAALIFGPDQGLVQERAEKLLKSVVPDLTDRLQCRRLVSGLLVPIPRGCSTKPPRSPCWAGGRVVRVRGAGNALAKLFERFLDEPAGDALVVVEGGDLAKGTGLRKVFDGYRAPRIACYPDHARSGRCGARRVARRRAFDCARRAGGCGVAAGFGPWRDAARDSKSSRSMRTGRNRWRWKMSAP